MIFIKELFPDDYSVVIQVDGTLDSISIPILKKMCEKNLESPRKVYFNLHGLMYVDSEGKDFLSAMEKMGIVNSEIKIDLSRSIPRDSE